jgi:hypothetical protein
MPSRKKYRSSKINCTTKRTNPALWEKVKKEVLSSSKGGQKNKWSARKSQLSVALYKKRGGGYIGQKKSCNALTKWSREKWGYISSKLGSKKRGRYLPEVVRKHLSPSEKKRENLRKGSKRGKWVSYSPSVAKKMRKYKIV